jgi:hypothetical protein
VEFSVINLLNLLGHLVLSLEVLFLIDLVRFDCLRAWLPVSGAHLAHLISELEGLDQSDRFIH